MNTELLRKNATAAAAALFAVVGVSGVLIFFHLGEAQMKGMHEWLGLAFAIASILHVWRNFPAFSKMLGKRSFHVLAAVSLIAAGGFVAASFGQSGNPMRAMTDKMVDAPLSALAPVYGVSEDELLSRLTQAGVAVPNAAISLRQLSKNSGKPLPGLAAALNAGS